MVIPTFNQVDYLPACVDHCLFQTYANLELIIVDGGSQDHTKTYLRGLKNRIVETVVHPVDRMGHTGHRPYIGGRLPEK